MLGAMTWKEETACHSGRQLQCDETKDSGLSLGGNARGHQGDQSKHKEEEGKTTHFHAMLKGGGI